MNFIVSFDREVVVTGNPILPLTVQRPAVYVDGADTKSLGFNSEILQGDGASERLDISESIGAELLFPTLDDSVSLLINAPRTSPIKVDPKTVSLPSDQIISIDTTPPSVVSITPQDSTTPSGTYAVGDTLFFEVSFDEPVEVSSDLILISLLLISISTNCHNLLSLFLNHFRLMLAWNYTLTPIMALHGILLDQGRQLYSCNILSKWVM